MRSPTWSWSAAVALGLLADAGAAAARPHVIVPDVVDLDEDADEDADAGAEVAPVDGAQGLVIAGEVQVVSPEAIAAPLEVEPEPYGLPREPYGLPPSPRSSDDYPRESAFLMAGVAQGWLSGRAGMETFGAGGAVTLGFVQRDGDFPTGVDLSAILVRGEGGAVYDLSLRMIGSPKIGRRMLVPFVAIGLCAGASRIEGSSGPKLADAGDDPSWGLALGPSAALGLHGFLSDTLYWRAQAGFLGAGAGLFTGDVALGFVMD